MTGAAIPENSIVHWQQLSMDLTALDPDAVEVLFERHGAYSVTLTDAGDKPVLEPAPGETPLWPDSRITGLFAADADLAALLSDITDTFRVESLPAHEIVSDRYNGHHERHGEITYCTFEKQIDGRINEEP